MTILLVGADENLLRTRAALLAKTACATVCCTPEAALEVQAESRCEVAVFCHTVPDPVGVALAHIFRERWPLTRILQLLPQGEWGTRSAANLADATCYAEPQRLLDRAQELLHRSEPFVRQAVSGKTIPYLH